MVGPRCFFCRRRLKDLIGHRSPSEKPYTRIKAINRRKAVGHWKESLRQSTVQANEGGGKVKRCVTRTSQMKSAMKKP